MFVDNYERFAQKLFDAYKTVVNNLKEEDIFDAREDLDGEEDELAYNIGRFESQDEDFEKLSIGGVEFSISNVMIDGESVQLIMFFDVCLGKKERKKVLEEYSKTSISETWKMDADSFDETDFMISYFREYKDENELFETIEDALKTLADNIDVIENIVAINPQKAHKKKAIAESFTPYTLSGKYSSVFMDADGKLEFECAGKKVIYTLKDVSEAMITKSLFSAGVAFFKKGSKDYDNEGVYGFKKKHLDELVAALNERGIKFYFDK